MDASFPHCGVKGGGAHKRSQVNPIAELPFSAARSMPSEVQLQYLGAYYRVMARGNHREDIFNDEGDQMLFLSAQQELTGRLPKESKGSKL
jgi:hypothetical protein